MNLTFLNLFEMIENINNIEYGSVTSVIKIKFQVLYRNNHYLEL
jgi:hypothetical protein